MDVTLHNLSALSRLTVHPRFHTTLSPLSQFLPWPTLDLAPPLLHPHHDWWVDGVTRSGGNLLAAIRLSSPFCFQLTLSTAIDPPTGYMLEGVAAVGGSSAAMVAGSASNSAVDAGGASVMLVAGIFTPIHQGFSSLAPVQGQGSRRMQLFSLLRS